MSKSVSYVILGVLEMLLVGLAVIVGFPTLYAIPISWFLGWVTSILYRNE